MKCRMPHNYVQLWARRLYKTTANDPIKWQATTRKKIYIYIKKKLKKKLTYKKGEGVGQLIPLFKFRKSDKKKNREDRKDSAAES